MRDVRSGWEGGGGQRAAPFERAAWSQVGFRISPRQICGAAEGGGGMNRNRLRSRKRRTGSGRAGVGRRGFASVSFVAPCASIPKCARSSGYGIRRRRPTRSAISCLCLSPAPARPVSVNALIPSGQMRAWQIARGGLPGGARRDARDFARPAVANGGRRRLNFAN